MIRFKSFLLFSGLIFFMMSSFPTIAAEYGDYQKAVANILVSTEIQKKINYTLDKIHEPTHYDGPTFRGVSYADGLSSFGPNREIFNVVVGGYEQGRHCLRVSLNNKSYDDLQIEEEFRSCSF